jgi:hypothetical protein
VNGKKIGKGNKQILSHKDEIQLTTKKEVDNPSADKCKSLSLSSSSSSSSFSIELDDCQLAFNYFPWSHLLIVRFSLSTVTSKGKGKGVARNQIRFCKRQGMSSSFES